MSRHRWTEQDARRILEMVSERGPERGPIAAALGVPLVSLNNYVSHVLRDRYKAASDSYYARMRAQHEVAPIGRRQVAEVLTLPPAPFAVPIARPSKARPAKKWTTAVLYGDTHFPYQDDAALDVVSGVVRDVKPDVLLHVGDLVDCWQISRFDKDPTQLDTLQDNIDAARVHLHQMAQLAPDARKVLLEGNHENRLTRAIWQLEGAQRELPRLRVFQQAVTWPKLLELDGVGWEWVGERDQSRTPILPKIITKHGSVVRKWSGWSGKGEWEKYGRSGVSGHTHRLGWFVHRDHNGRSNWVESGCTCKLDAPYGSDFDWQQGCVVMTWSADQLLQNVEFVSIRDGRAIWRNAEYGVKRAA